MVRRGRETEDVRGRVGPSLQDRHRRSSHRRSEVENQTRFGSTQDSTSGKFKQKVVLKSYFTF